MAVDNNDFVLGVDLDGVCADFYTAMRQVVADWRGVPLADLPEHVSYGLAEWGVPSTEEYGRIHRWAVTERDLFGQLPMIPGVRQALRRLSNDQFHIRIITHRLFIPYFHRQAVEQTVAWLDSNAIPYGDLCFMADKSLVNADVYVEDTAKHITQLEGTGKHVIAFTNSTNIKMEPAPVLRAKDWTEAEEIIRRIHSER